MRTDRQDFDDVTDHMNLIITFIGLMVLCQQKASQNKQISVCCVWPNIMQQDQDYAKD